MRAVKIYAPRDLRVEETSSESPGAGQVEVAISVGGICGSDLHYYQHGGFGSVRLREPMILGHEVAGTVRAVGPGVVTLAPGDLVAVNPSRPCGNCDYCRRGMTNHCREMRFYGSAMRFPHVQGAFREGLVVEADRCFKFPSGTSLFRAAVTEPFAVALHAVAQAGPLIDRRVLVSGSGPIGALVVLAARIHGAREIVATDILDIPLATAEAMGATRTINTAKQPEAMAEFAAGKGTFDILFEASGSPAAIEAGVQVLKPRGILVQLGLGGTMNLPQDRIVTHEIDVRGSFRFREEFELAAALIAHGRADVDPLITQKFDVARAAEAFELARDRTKAMKVQLVFAG